MIKDPAASAPWGPRQRLQSPIFYGGLVFAALIGIAGGIAADGTPRGITTLALLMVVGTGLYLSFTLPQPPASRSGSQTKNAIGLSFVGLMLLAGVLAYRALN